MSGRHPSGPIGPAREVLTQTTQFRAPSTDGRCVTVALRELPPSPRTRTGFSSAWMASGRIDEHMARGNEHGSGQRADGGEASSLPGTAGDPRGPCRVPAEMRDQRAGAQAQRKALLAIIDQFGGGPAADSNSDPEFEGLGGPKSMQITAAWSCGAWGRVCPCRRSRRVPGRGPAWSAQPHPGRHWTRRADCAGPRRRRLSATYKRPHGVRHVLAAYDLSRDRLYGHIKLAQAPHRALARATRGGRRAWCGDEAASAWRGT